MRTNQKENYKYKKGITLFIAVLVASVTTLLSFAISDIALREVILAQTGKDSQISFYSANNGIECALFWDLKKDAFSPGSTLITCNGNTRTATIEPLLGGIDTETWKLYSPLVFPLFDGSDTDDPCFIVDSVTKNVKKLNGNIVSIETEIVVKGYNTCNSDSPRRLERALKVKY